MAGYPAQIQQHAGASIHLVIVSEISRAFTHRVRDSLPILSEMLPELPQLTHQALQHISQQTRETTCAMLRRSTSAASNQAMVST